MKKMILQRERFPASQLPGLQMAAFPSSSNTPTPASHTSLFCTHRQTWGSDVLCVCCLWSCMYPHTHSHCLVIGHLLFHSIHSVSSFCSKQSLRPKEKKKSVINRLLSSTEYQPIYKRKLSKTGNYN